MKRHQLTHEKKFTLPKNTDKKDKVNVGCDLCTFYFLLVIAQQVMECEFCDRKFKYRKSFNHHMQTEHGMSDDSDVPLSSFVPKLEVSIEEEEIGELLHFLNDFPLCYNVE